MRSPPVNLADPDCEPTDEQFRELLHGMGQEVSEANAATLDSYWREIRRMAAENLARLALDSKPDDASRDAALEFARSLGSGSGARIRCPGCLWQPTEDSRWQCEPSCGEVWNTFDTRGKCPRCSSQWTHTACLSCHGWFLHDDWYTGSRGADC